MAKYTYPVATAALFAALAATSVVSVGTATAATGTPDLAISADRAACTVTVTNKGPVTAINAAVFRGRYGGITTPSFDLAPGASYTVPRDLDCYPGRPPALAYTYDTNGDSNFFNNITLS